MNQNFVARSDHSSLHRVFLLPKKFKKSILLKLWTKEQGEI